MIDLAIMAAVIEKATGVRTIVYPGTDIVVYDPDKRWIPICELHDIDHHSWVKSVRLTPELIEVTKLALFEIERQMAGKP